MMFAGDVMTCDLLTREKLKYVLKPTKRLLLNVSVLYRYDTRYALTFDTRDGTLVHFSNKQL